MDKEIAGWKASLGEGELAKIGIIDLVEAQMEEGNKERNEEKCFEIIDENKSIWLDRSALNVDESRVSKKASIGIFNKVIDLVAVT